MEGSHVIPMPLMVFIICLYHFLTPWRSIQGRKKTFTFILQSLRDREGSEKVWLSALRYRVATRAGSILILVFCLCFLLKHKKQNYPHPPVTLSFSSARYIFLFFLVLSMFKTCSSSCVKAQMKYEHELRTYYYKTLIMPTVYKCR